jgi:tetratricopeptide (TPR) repeat protein
MKIVLVQIFILAIIIIGQAAVGQISVSDLKKEASTYYDLKNYNESLESINKWLDENNKDPDALYLKGKILKEIGRDNESIGFLKDAGFQYYFSNNYTESINCYKTVLKIDPRNAEAMYRIGLALCNIDKMKEARAYWSNASKLDALYSEANSPWECRRSSHSPRSSNRIDSSSRIDIEQIDIVQDNQDVHDVSLVDRNQDKGKVED